MAHCHVACIQIKEKFNTSLKGKPLPNEFVIADYGYGREHVLHDINGNNDYSSVFLARHETTNRRLKCFNILGGVFKHELSLH